MSTLRVAPEETRTQHENNLFQLQEYEAEDYNLICILSERRNTFLSTFAVYNEKKDFLMKDHFEEIDTSEILTGLGINKATYMMISFSGDRREMQVKRIPATITWALLAQFNQYPEAYDKKIYVRLVFFSDSAPLLFIPQCCLVFLGSVVFQEIGSHVQSFPQLIGISVITVIILLLWEWTGWTFGEIGNTIVNNDTRAIILARIFGGFEPQWFA